MTLRPADRCDRCGARAYATATLPSGALLLCGHHLREHGPALRAQGAIVCDETADIDNPALGMTPTP